MKKIGIGAIIAGALLLIIGARVKSTESATIAVIGGADGPTSILVAGPDVSMAAMAGMALGAAALLIGVAAILKKRK